LEQCNPDSLTSSLGVLILEKAIQLLKDPKTWVNFNDAVHSPKWGLLEKTKLSPRNRYCIIALASNATSRRDLEEQAGLFGKDGLCKEVKLFWRNIAYKLISEPEYTDLYKKELDNQYKRNVDRKSGKLELSHLKFRARAATLSHFIHNIMGESKLTA